MAGEEGRKIDDDLLRSYLRGELKPKLVAQLEKLLAKNEKLRTRLEKLSRDEVRTTRAPISFGASSVGSSPVEQPTLEIPPELAEYDQYQVLKELGRGGMGIVYLANNVPLDRWEVLKVLNPSLYENDIARKRFQAEIRAVAKLNHPAIVNAFGILPLQNLIVFAMEYLDGTDLEEFIFQNKPLAIGQACSIASQIAAGLQHAYSKDLVHRDIKPSNVIVFQDEDGQWCAKILDFGLVKADEQADERTKLTQDNALLGTPAYMAPEQIKNSATANIQSDIYSLGCTLYHMLCGQPPFTGGYLDVCVAQVHDVAKPLNAVRPDVPVPLANIVAAMMAKEPSQRYQFPKDVQAALAPFTGDPSRADFAGGLPGALPGSETLNDLPQRDTSVPGIAAEGVPVAEVVVTAVPLENTQAMPFQTGPARTDLMIDQNSPRRAGAGGRRPRRWIPWLVAIGFVLAAAAFASPLISKMQQGTLTSEDLPDGALDTVEGDAIPLPDTENEIASNPPLVSEPPMVVPAAPMVASSTPASPLVPVDSAISQYKSRVAAASEKLKQSAAMLIGNSLKGVQVTNEQRTNEELTQLGNRMLWEMREFSSSGRLPTSAGILPDSIVYMEELQDAVSQLREAFEPHIAAAGDDVVAAEKQREHLDSVLALHRLVLLSYKANRGRPGVWTLRSDGMILIEDETGPGRIKCETNNGQFVFRGLTSGWVDTLKWDFLGEKLTGSDAYGYPKSAVRLDLEGSTQSMPVVSSVPAESTTNEPGKLQPFFVPGSQWRGTSGSPYSLEVVERKGNAFRALLYLRDGKTREAMGQIEGDCIFWEENQVEAIKDTFGFLSESNGDYRLEIIERPYFGSFDAGRRNTNKFVLANLPTDSVTLGKVRYAFFDQRLSWDDAKQRCDELGGTLAIVESAAQNEFLANEAKKKGIGYLWLGATDRLSEGNWIWLRGRPMTYSGWEGTPHAEDTEAKDYLALNAATSRWVALQEYPEVEVDSPRLGFVCQWDTFDGASKPASQTRSVELPERLDVASQLDINFLEKMLDELMREGDLTNGRKVARALSQHFQGTSLEPLLVHVQTYDPANKSLDLSKVPDSRFSLSDAMAEKGSSGVRKLNRGASSRFFLKPNGEFHAKGIVVSDKSNVVYSLQRKWKRFTAKVGTQDARWSPHVIFTVRGDGRILYRSDPLDKKRQQGFEIDVSNVMTLELSTELPPNAYGSGEHIWASPYVSR